MFTPQRVLNLFGSDATRSSLMAAERSGVIPPPDRALTGSIERRQWRIDQLPKLGERYGFMKIPPAPVCIAIYSAKGGVFKTSLALNLGRMAALHNIRTCIIGLDFQRDITHLLGESPNEDDEDIAAAIARINGSVGLVDMFVRNVALESVLHGTDIPTLQYIPETAGLISLERLISGQDRREYRLLNVIMQLKKCFDLIILDCPPSWSNLITNALVACDLLLSPVECKISQFNSLTVFRDHIETFNSTMGLHYEHMYVPTRFTPTRRLSNDIRGWYVENLDKVSIGAIREAAAGEEAVAAKVSLPEHAPNTATAHEMRELLREIWTAACHAMSHARAAS